MTLVVDGAVTLAVGWRQGKKILGGRVELTTEVADFLRTVASNAAQEIGERTDKPYSADSHLEHDEVFVLPVASALIESNIIDIVRNATPLPRIGAGDLPRKPLLFYAAVVGDDPTARTSFVRATNPVVTAGTGRVLTRLAQSLTSVSEPVFALERRVDLAVTDDQIYVLNQATFERLFRDLPEVLDRIPDWLADATATLPMSASSLAALQERCEANGTLRRRLRAIYERGHLAQLTIDDVRSEAERQGLNAEALIVEGQLSLENVDAATMLKLLNEDLMTGGLTGTRFLVDRKTPRR